MTTCPPASRMAPTGMRAGPASVWMPRLSPENVRKRSRGRRVLPRAASGRHASSSSASSSGGHTFVVDGLTLEEALLEFAGCVVVVSHDRYFISRVANRIVELRDGELVLYRGNYAYYLEKKEEERVEEREKHLAAEQEVKRKANRDKQKARQERRKKAA